MTKPWNVIGVFCEDIREEKNGQVSIVGILPDSIQLSPPPEPTRAKAAMPSVLPKLGLYVRLLMPLEGLRGPMPISLSMPGGGSLPLGEIDNELIEKATREARESELPLAGVVFYALLQGFQIAKPGLVSAVLEHEGKQQICAILNVRPSILA